MDSKYKKLAKTLEDEYDVIIIDIFQSGYRPDFVSIIVNFKKSMVYIPDYKIGNVLSIDFGNNMAFFDMPISSDYINLITA